MSFCTKIGVVLLLALAVGCQEVPRYLGGGKVVLAEAAGKKLYARDVRTVIPQGMTGEDSVAFMNRYIEKWVHRQLKLREAEQLFSDSERDIDSLVEEYRQALLIRKFDQHLIDERIDTLITAAQIADYHREHLSDFKVNQTLVKGRIVRFEANNRQAQKLRKLMAQNTPSQQQDFADICTKNNFVLNDYSSSWVTFSEFLGYLPTLRSQSYDALLSSRTVQEMSDGHSRYYFEITDVLRPGDPEPLERSEAIVRRILYNQRQNEIIRAYDQEVYAKAVEEGKVKIHEEEKDEKIEN